MGLELHEHEPGRYEVVTVRGASGTVTIGEGSGGTVAICDLVAHLGVEDARELVRRLDAMGVRRIEARELLIRREARSAGFAGPLRAPLDKTSRTYQTEFTAQIEELLPATKVRLVPHRNRWLRLAASSAGGVAGMTRLNVEPLDGRRTIRVHLPERDDQLAEVVALAVDTTLAIHARFGRFADHARTISFDYSVEGMRAGEIAGVAAHHPGWFHLNAAFSFARGLDRLGELRRAATAVEHSGSASGWVPKPWTIIDGVVAHELWHTMELAWEARNYAETVEFRREIGGWFGHATLEHVFDDPVARSGLAQSVSPYAATNRLEATAEMFELWWCGPAPAGSVAERFGALLERRFAHVQG